jgi:hypothetical protein
MDDDGGDWAGTLAGATERLLHVGAPAAARGLGTAAATWPLLLRLSVTALRTLLLLVVVATTGLATPIVKGGPVAYGTWPSRCCSCAMYRS